jgi:FkbM family methyltransferase
MSALRTLKRMVNAGLGLYGHAVARSSEVPSFERLAQTLRTRNLEPATVFDIGVAYGTPWLYTAFSSCRYHLIDPTRESLPHMRKWAEKLDADVHSLALGEAEGSARISVRHEIGGSSLFDEIGEAEILTSYEVPVARFDATFRTFQRPALCKIDVQGAELMVLRGMGERLADIDVLIVETSLIPTLHGEAPDFGDVVVHLREQGFALYEIVSMVRRPLDQALAQVDGVFVPVDSPLRSDRRWAA